MKLLLINILIFFISFSSFAQADLGLGLVSFNFGDSSVLHFYELPTDKQPVKNIVFFHDRRINSLNIRNLEKQQEWLNPEVLWLDYSSLIFRTRKIKDDWLEVVVNNETGKTLWLKKSNQTVFSSWEEYLMGMFSISRLPGKKQIIRKHPREGSEEIRYSGQDCFQIKSMQGDWVEIFTPEHCDGESTDSKAKIISGWIKWRQGNDILINYFITG